MPLFLQSIDLVSLILLQMVLFSHEKLYMDWLVKRVKGNKPVDFSLVELNSSVELRFNTAKRFLFVSGVTLA